MFNQYLFNSIMFNESSWVSSEPIGLFQFNGMNLPNPFFILDSAPNIYSVTNINISNYTYAGMDWAGETDLRLWPKPLSFAGVIKGDTPEDLARNIRAMQVLLVAQKKPFYWRTPDGKFLFALATCKGLNIPVKGYHITMAPCDFNIMISEGTLRELTPQEITYSDISTNYSQIISNVHGTRPAKPTLSYVFKSAVSVTSVQVTLGDKTILVTGNFEEDDTLFIDSFNKVILKNGVPNLEYVWEFPELGIGETEFTNNLNWTFLIDIIVNWLPIYV